MTDLFYAFKIEAKFGTSGQPRRGWLIYNAEGTLRGFANDGARGSGALKNAAASLVGNSINNRQHNGGCAAQVNGNWESYGPLRNVRLIELGIVNVPAAEYRTALNHIQF